VETLLNRFLILWKKETKKPVQEERTNIVWRRRCAGKSGKSGCGKQISDRYGRNRHVTRRNKSKNWTTHGSWPVFKGGGKGRIRMGGDSQRNMEKKRR